MAADGQKSGQATSMEFASRCLALKCRPIAAILFTMSAPHQQPADNGLVRANYIAPNFLICSNGIKPILARKR
jgi:hypothetical protein